MGKGSGKMKRSGRKKGYYTAQFLRTARNKARRAKKRADKKAFWALQRLTVTTV